MKCPVCGANNAEDARFCSLCLTPFRGDGSVSPPITSQYSTPPDYPDDTEEPPIKHPGKFSDWFARFGCLTICLILVIPLALIFLPPLISQYFPPESGAACLRVDETTFQEEVLESQIPVLVVFCTDELWNRTRAGFSTKMGTYVTPTPIIVAVKKVADGGEYEGNVKFCKYYRTSGDDPLDAKYDIEWWPTTMIFIDGSVFWRTSAPGCTAQPDQSIELIEAMLERALREM